MLLQKPGCHGVVLLSSRASSAACKLKASLVKPTDNHLLVLQAEAQGRCLFWKPFCLPFLCILSMVLALSRGLPLNSPFSCKGHHPYLNTAPLLLTFSFILSFPKLLFSDLHMHSLDPIPIPQNEGEQKHKTEETPKLSPASVSLGSVSLHFNLFTSGPLAWSLDLSCPLESVILSPEGSSQFRQGSRRYSDCSRFGFFSDNVL